MYRQAKAITISYNHIQYSCTVLKMPDLVNAKRKYTSNRRAEQAADTRERIVLAARTLFVTEGWHKATIARIAKAARVSSETVYAVFGTKPAILQAVVELAIRGEAPDVALLDQTGPRRVTSTADPRRLLELFSDDLALVLDRVAELVAVAQTAAQSEADMKHLYEQLHQGRRRNLGVVAQALVQTGALGPEVDVDAVTTELWRLGSPELFLLLTKIEGLSVAEYAAWLNGVLVARLLVSKGGRSRD
ncbi:TetR/AcrR family transcriptional regulator [Devosia rhodophyticola]|uniref:TetR/AcrR family transcriptional regulator n=1 Tax=Devosia rhodophyticola TaxID=3026423 RepID=A0ABY7Z1K1_9HYPH|nr:TetR/AcrR family transcriptional regulator [Devosia rhodophyticola]WDR07168.1 TetR/AcrR family transcriptional regulator [Devosia rhodophyticola]